MRFRTTIKERMLILAACQASIAILLIATSLRVESKAIQDYYRLHWILALAIVATALAGFLSFSLTISAASRLQNLVSHVRRFQDSGRLERISDRGGDNLSVLANALDAGFASIASREQEREQFMAIAAHELKTPITTIQGYASFLLLHPLTVDTTRALEIINRQSWRMSRLIEALLLAVRARTTGLRFDPKPLDMSELVSRVLHEMEPFLSKKVFTSEISDGISILGDEALLEHALWTLFTCASAISPNHAVKVSLSRNHRVRLAVDIDPSDVSLTALEELFLPFRSLQFETADGLRSPIGLYLCREIVRMHDGRLYVHELSQSSPEFLMELPI